MTKNFTFNDLPAAMEKVLDILSSGESGYAALPELVQRINLLEKKIDYLQKTVFPEMAVMDIPTVCRILKLRPKAVKELAESGVLPTRTEGRKTFFYEEGVVKYFMTQPAWNSAVGSASKSASTEPESEPEDTMDGERRRVDIKDACKILGRSSAAIYQLTAKQRVPYHKEGSKVYFYSDELREWLKNHPPLKRRQRTK